mgnify:CR=1 FL=1
MALKLIVGLGNPGEKYQKTRHNAGFTILDLLCKQLDFEPFHEEKKFKAELSIGEFEDEKVILAKPLTFMNLSGAAVQKILHYYKIPVSDCMIVYDDLDIDFGQIRIRKKGGPGTHNGMKSVVSAIGENFPRLRFGVENRQFAQKKRQNAESFVIAPFAKTEQAALKKALKHAADAIYMYLKNGTDDAMNRYN